MTFRQASPEYEEVELRILDGDSSGVSIREWSEYSFNSHFLTPADAFSFSVGQEDLTIEAYNAMVPGAKVGLFINSHQQCTGYIDSIERSASRDGGVEWRIEGRDIMGPIVDGSVDPKLQFKPGMKLSELILKALEPYGWAPTFEDDNDANLNVMTGQKRGTRTSKKGKTAKNAGVGQLRPHPQEGTFAFISRISQRLGLWIWPSAKGDKIIVSTPNFTNNSGSYSIRRRFDGVGNNVLSGSVTVDLSDQPTIIVADGFSGGGQFGKSRIKAVMANPFIEVKGKPSSAFIAEIQEKYKGIVVVKPPFTPPSTMTVPRPKIVYFHDEESHTQEQLENYVLRELSLLTRKFVSAKYTVAGHFVINDEEETLPWAVDTIVEVDDEVGGLKENMWVLSRTFTKGAGSRGTKTSLELIKLHTLEF